MKSFVIWILFISFISINCAPSIQDVSDVPETLTSHSRNAFEEIKRLIEPTMMRMKFSTDKVEDDLEVLLEGQQEVLSKVYTIIETCIDELLQTFVDFIHTMVVTPSNDVIELFEKLAVDLDSIVIDAQNGITEATDEDDRGNDEIERIFMQLKAELAGDLTPIFEIISEIDAHDNK